MSGDFVNGFWIDINLEYCSIDSGCGDFDQSYLDRVHWYYVGDSRFNNSSKSKKELKDRSKDFIQEKINLLTSLLDDIDSL